MIFVFGSNLAGIHGAGAAKVACEQYGAVWGDGWGPQGQSYAIPTKDYRIQTLPLAVIKEHVDRFVAFAMMHGELQFQVTQIGCGLAGYTADQIAPMFQEAPSNVFFDEAWRCYLPTKSFWGTF